MKKTIIILPFQYETTIAEMQTVNNTILNLIGRINVEEEYFNTYRSRIINIIPYNGIFSEEQKRSIMTNIENIIKDNVITGIIFLEGEENKFEQTIQIK